jgi:hypothetical protein
MAPKSANSSRPGSHKTGHAQTYRSRALSILAQERVLEFMDGLSIRNGNKALQRYEFGVLHQSLIELFELPRMVELRWLSAGRTFSLFTTSLRAMEKAIADPRLSGLNSYLVINPPRPEVLEHRRIRPDEVFHPFKGQCCADADIVEYVLLPFDFDPRRSAGTASTDEQRSIARKQRDLQDTYLTKMGFPDSVALVDSGNGLHDYRRTRLANDEATAFRLNALYNCLARKFGTPDVIFDKSVRSPAQLMRLPGSVNHKARRASSFLNFNDSAGLVTLDMIQAVTEDLRGQLGFKHPLVARRGPWTHELMERFLQFYSVDYLPPVEIAQGVLYVLNPCPLNADHVGSSPAVVVTKRGWAKFCCKHESCRMSWALFRSSMFALTGKFFLTTRRNKC